MEYLSDANNVICPVRLPDGANGNDIERLFIDCLVKENLAKISQDIGLLCIVCGLDGIAGDPIGASQVNWTGLTAQHISRMLSSASDILPSDAPMIVFGGGGYDPCTFSSSAAFITMSQSREAGINLKKHDIPEHEFYPEYRKCGFELALGIDSTRGGEDLQNDQPWVIFQEQADQIRHFFINKTNCS